MVEIESNSREENGKNEERWVGYERGKENNIKLSKK